MSQPSTVRVSSRKQPKQARSSGLVASVLEAAAQVLAAEGAHRFTTARVAEKAGVSVGSLYQYFPNKASILFQLQKDEWARTTGLLRRLLEDRSRSPLERLRAAALAFVRSECDEAAMRIALADAAPHYREAPEAKTAKSSGADVIGAFVAEVLPNASATQRALVAGLIGNTLARVGKSFSERPHTASELAGFADAMADMLCAYLAEVQRKASDCEVF